MQSSLVLLILLGLMAVAYQLGRRRSVSVAGGPGLNAKHCTVSTPLIEGCRPIAGFHP